MLDTVVMSGDDVCCSVVFGTLVGVFVFRVIWSELLMTSAISSIANSKFLGLVSVGAARSFGQTALRPSVIKRIRQIDVKYITHITSLGVTA